MSSRDKNNVIVFYRRQNGAVIFLALILLLAISLVSISSMRESVHQQQITTSMLEQSMAFETAEQALAAGEAWLQARVADNTIRQAFAGQTIAGVTLQERATWAAQWWLDKDHDNWASGQDVTSNNVLGARSGSYVIEVIGRDVGSTVQIGSSAGPVTLNYRVTARGFGVNPGHYVVLQSTVGIKI